jgi:adenylate kinase
MQIVFLGPPGAGKGTQAVKISSRYDIPHISTGDMLRQQVASGSPLGTKVKSILDSGELVTDDIIMQVVEARLSQPDCKKGFLLDGIPRTVGQAQTLGTLLLKMGTPKLKVLQINVPDEVLLERIQARQGESSRSDDTAEVAAKRLRVYWEQTAPVANYYEQQGNLVKLDGVGTVEEVFSRITTALGA